MVSFQAPTPSSRGRVLAGAMKGAMACEAAIFPRSCHDHVCYSTAEPAGAGASGPAAGQRLQDSDFEAVILKINITGNLGPALTSRRFPKQSRRSELAQPVVSHAINHRAWRNVT